jgi:hypothetical protein
VRCVSYIRALGRFACITCDCNRADGSHVARYRVLFRWFLLPEDDKGKEWRLLMPFCVISVIACALSLRLLFSEYSGVGNLIQEGSEGSAPCYYILYLLIFVCARTCRLQVLRCRPPVPIQRSVRGGAWCHRAMGETAFLFSAVFSSLLMVSSRALGSAVLRSICRRFSPPTPILQRIARRTTPTPWLHVFQSLHSSALIVCRYMAVPWT